MCFLVHILSLHIELHRFSLHSVNVLAKYSKEITTFRAVASMRQTEALASVIVFFFSGKVRFFLKEKERR